MRETHYIDIDEEIITAVSRLRHSNQVENVFVFPKRALILQSIVNLRLLEREAQKLGKKIIITTQDEAGKKLAERAGLMVEAYSERVPLEHIIPQQKITSEPIPVNGAAKSSLMSPASIPVTSETLGSSDFYAPPQVISPLDQGMSLTQESTSIRQTMPLPRPIRVRNSNPSTLTSLNSMRSDGVVARPPIDPVTRQAPASPVTRPIPMVHEEKSHAAPLQTPVSIRQGRLERFMGGNNQSIAKSVPPTKEREVSTERYSSSSKRGGDSTSFRWAIPFGIMLFIGGIGFLGWYVFFPKVVITLTPQSAEQVVKLQISAAAGSGDAATVAARVISFEKTFQTKDSATGTAAAGDASKARGSIRIYNDFSSDSQPLVATTRFETTDGKIFRLVQSVVVPGVKEKDGKRERGVVEAVVVADQAGSQYNVSPTKFTIPGFKGGSKYEKFSAESVQKFNGGSDGGVGGGTTQKLVSNDDKERAAKKTIDESRSHVLEEVRKQLGEEEELLEDSLLIEKISDTVTPTVGSAAAEFTYEGRYLVKVFVINETEVKKRIEAERVNASGVSLSPKAYTKKYTALLPKYETSQVDMTVESTILFEAPIDIAMVRQNLLGRNEAGIKEFLGSHPEIERLQVEFKPQLLVSTIPEDTDRVEVELLTAQ